MISLYKITGFCLLMGSAASLVSLAAFLEPNFREIGLLLAILASFGLGMAGAATYFLRESLGEQYPLYVVLIISIGVLLLVGGAIQWVF